MFCQEKLSQSSECAINSHHQLLRKIFHVYTESKLTVIRGRKPVLPDTACNTQILFEWCFEQRNSLLFKTKSAGKEREGKKWKKNIVDLSKCIVSDINLFF